MTEATTTIRVSEKQRENGLWVFTSDDLPGFIQIGKDQIELRAKTPVFIQEYFRKHRQMAVDVRRWVDPQLLHQNVRDDRPPSMWTVLGFAH